MSHQINPYTARIQPYEPLSQPSGAASQRPAAQAEPATPRPPSAAASAAAGGLSTAEQQMIDRYFPPAPALALRLYGPDRSTQTVNPGAVGTRLDLRG